MSIKYYCINIAKETTRRDRIEAIGTVAGIPIEFITAVSGKNIDPQSCEGYDDHRRKLFAKSLTPNEVACVLSHKKALNAFLSSDHEFAVILEDDADFDKDFNQKVSMIAKRVKGFDTVNLYSKGKFLSESGDLVFTRVIVHAKLSFRTVAYLYSKNGAKKVLKSLNRFYHPYDTHLGFAWRYGLYSVGIYPPIARHPEMTISTIGDRLSDEIPGFSPWLIRRAESIIVSLVQRIWARVVTQKVTIN